MGFNYQTTVFGQLVRTISRGRILKYPDEIDPSLWKQATLSPDQQHLRKLSTGKASDPANECDNSLKEGGNEISASISDEEKRQNVEDVGKSTNSIPKMNPQDENVLVVGWYGPDDPENPRNWSRGVKHVIVFQICLLNFCVYIASSIYTPGETFLVQDFGVSLEVATLGLSLFTLGYGMGPMLWSPLSELPSLGRSMIYFYTLLAFILLELPVGFAPNVAVFLVFRWATGFCGSPCLAIGGGTINDMFQLHEIPTYLCLWASAGVLAPVMGPLIGGFVAPAEGWRWTIWVFTWLCCAALVLTFFFFPETSADNILYRRAKRLRQLTGNDRLRSQTEIDSESYSPKDNLRLMMRAFTLTFFEPIILLVDLYAGLVYGLLFVWFESFPYVFGGIYHFNSGEQGLVFIGILTFAVITVPCYILWRKKYITPRIKSGNFKPEMILGATYVGAFSLPICLFMFAWTSRASVPWIVPVIGSGLFAIGIVTLFQTLYLYTGVIFSRYSASVFAGAALFRASFGASFPLFARPLFNAIGIGPGNSLLGGIAILFIPIPFIFRRYGERIRSWSKYTE